ncbi:MAG TPA: hypothetical protein VD905_12345, partial [Flavobacteriales bacterium]|nr:hypothetical protein [Flavobacteriales bacterium]
MKTKFLLTLFTFLCVFNLSLFAQTNFALKSTAWYVDEVWKSGQEASKQKFKYGDNVVRIDESNHYEMNNFLGVTRQQGALIESQGVLVLSNAKETGYFWVFEVIKKTPQEVVLKYIPHTLTSDMMEVRLLPYVPVIETKAAADPLPAAGNPAIVGATFDFNGQWSIDIDGFNMQLTLEQKGMAISGTHCSGSNCQGSYRLEGVVQGDTAIVSLHSASGEYFGK